MIDRLRSLLNIYPLNTKSIATAEVSKWHILFLDVTVSCGLLSQYLSTSENISRPHQRLSHKKLGWNCKRSLFFLHFHLGHFTCRPLGTSGKKYVLKIYSDFDNVFELNFITWSPFSSSESNIWPNFFLINILQKVLFLLSPPPGWNCHPHITVEKCTILTSHSHSISSCIQRSSWSNFHTMKHKRTQLKIIYGSNISF